MRREIVCLTFPRFCTMERSGGRIGATFKRMKAGLCPLEISSYGRCVIAASTTEPELKDACVKEFAALRKCFMSARPRR